MRYGVVYRVSNLETGKYYIGRTKRPLYERWYNHCHRSSKCPYLNHAIQKYGKENFSIHEIASSWDSESLNELEVLLIKQENTMVPNGYNLIAISAGISEVSEDTRQKISKSNKGHSRNKGQIFSEEHKKKLSDIAKKRVFSIETRIKMALAAKNRVCSEETRQKLREARKTFIFSEETRIKMSKSQKGKKHSEEARRKISEALKVRICSEETRKRLSESNKGKKHSEETRRKISEARRARTTPIRAVVNH